MLYIYIAAHCRACDTASRRAEELQKLRPEVVVRVVDVEAPGADVPPKVIGTPMYIWNDRIVFRGNPSMAELLERVRELQEGNERTRTG